MQIVHHRQEGTTTMMHRILEAFARPHDQVTGFDDIIMGVTVVAVFLVLLALFYSVIWFLTRERNR